MLIYDQEKVSKINNLNFYNKEVEKLVKIKHKIRKEILEIRGELSKIRNGCKQRKLIKPKAIFLKISKIDKLQSRAEKEVTNCLILAMKERICLQMLQISNEQ